MNESLTDKLTETLKKLEIDKHKIAEFIEKTLERRRIARDDKLLKDRLKELTEIILQQFEDAEMVESIRVKGYNVKPARELWAAAKDGDFEGSCDVLIASGHSEYVGRRFDSRRVSALVREYDAGDGIPEELQNGLSITEKFKLSMTKAPLPKRSKR